ncbi:MAG: hypothetical protein ABIH86_01845 [Planctomycetota bacterium]
MTDSRSPENDPALTGGFSIRPRESRYGRLVRGDIAFLIPAAIVFFFLLWLSTKNALALQFKFSSLSLVFAITIGCAVSCLAPLIWASIDDPARHYGPMAIFSAPLFFFNAALETNHIAGDLGWALLLGVMAQLIRRELILGADTRTKLGPYGVALVGVAIILPLFLIGASMSWRCSLQLTWALALIGWTFLMETIS